ncbi:MAG TPA: glycosyltransferase family 1 protein [Blastocatellia bacterium]|nr:glycosyltransferase family 1 protein [Blastocatellia bacterium]
MRILYDGGASQESGAGGIKRYFTNLISRLPQDFEPHLTTCRRADETAPSHPRLRVHRLPRFRPQRVSLKLEKAFFSRVEGSCKFDIAHPSYYTLLSQREVGQYQCPVVITVWDMIHEIFPGFDPSGSFIARKQRAIEAADAILCISENTKRDLLERYKVDEARVSVTYLAADLMPGHVDGAKNSPARPYFLYVGTRASYKNFHGLLSAFADATTLAPEIMLNVVGPRFDSTEEQKLADLGLRERVKNFGAVSDTELATLYHHSVALVYPSLYEGFGIPPLEAMQCGTLVVAANRSSIPEVVGDAGILFDPQQPDALTDILVHLARNPDARQSYIERGYKRSKLFSWDKTAQQTVEVYQNLAP